MLLWGQPAPMARSDRRRWSRCGACRSRCARMGPNLLASAAAVCIPAPHRPSHHTVTDTGSLFRRNGFPFTVGRSSDLRKSFRVKHNWYRFHGLPSGFFIWTGLYWLGRSLPHVTGNVRLQIVMRLGSSRYGPGYRTIAAILQIRYRTIIDFAVLSHCRSESIVNVQKSIDGAGRYLGIVQRDALFAACLFHAAEISVSAADAHRHPPGTPRYPCGTLKNTGWIGAVYR